MLFKVICLRLRGAFALATPLLCFLIWLLYFDCPTKVSPHFSQGKVRLSWVLLSCKARSMSSAKLLPHSLQRNPTILPEYFWSTDQIGLIFEVHFHLKRQFHFMRSNSYWSLIQGSSKCKNCWGPEVQDHHSRSETSGPPSPWARSEALR